MPYRISADQENFLCNANTLFEILVFLERQDTDIFLKKHGDNLIKIVDIVYNRAYFTGYSKRWILFLAMSFINPRRLITFLQIIDFGRMNGVPYENWIDILEGGRD